MIFKRKKNQKGQMEVFGLAVIVILISIGFFLYVSFKVKETPQTPQKDYTNDRMANDFVLAILNVNIDSCAPYTVEDLIIDCAKQRNIQCGYTSDNSCIVLNKTINTLIDSTFGTATAPRAKLRMDSAGLMYENKELIDMKRGECTSKSRQGQRGTALISLYPEPSTVYINLNLCY